MSATGWTSLHEGAILKGMAWKRADGSEGSTVTMTIGGTIYYVQVHQFSGVEDTGDPVDAWDAVTASGNTALSEPMSLTTSTGGCMIVYHDHTFANRSLEAPPSGMTTITTGNADPSPQHAFYQLQASAGGTGTKQCDVDGANIAHYDQIIALKPEGGGPPPAQNSGFLALI